MTPLHDGLLQGLITVLAFTSFVGICYYAYSPSRRKAFEVAANSPLADEGKGEPS
ncbi:cbb3-type cytochrome oxidase subunit 3 [Hydrocarboniphaga effusa]|uniref:cbb3-type cytochrome oxidase subunit 3 n=1 Tax=Hydrocarboniphaga effusa TaxID=243629 RepID=UPI003BADA061